MSGPESNNDRQTIVTIPVADLRFQVAFVIICQQLRIVNKEYKGRCRHQVVRSFVDLGGVEQFESFIRPEGWRTRSHGILEQSVQRTRSNRPSGMLLDPFDAGKKAIEIFAGLGGDQVNRGVTQKEKVSSNLANQSVNEIAKTGVGLTRSSLFTMTMQGLWFSWIKPATFLS